MASLLRKFGALRGEEHATAWGADAGIRAPKGQARRVTQHRLRLGWVALTVIQLVTGCSKTPPAPTSRSPGSSGDRATLSEPWFEEISAQANIHFKHVSGASGRFWMPESMCGGAGLLDYDRDGLLDIYCVNGGSLDPGVTNSPGHKLYRNLGNWQFEDVTERAGVGGQFGYGMGCACADYDGDGDIDIYVANVGRNVLFRNNGDGTFADVTRDAGVGDESWSASSAFFDYDGDSRLDLVVANYVKWSREGELQCFSHGGQRDYCSPMNYKAPSMATLYHNKGNGTFENVTLAAGLDRAYGNGLGVACADFDRDGRLDIFVANDAMPNQLWLNQGHGKFIDQAMIRGCAVNMYGVSRAGMGVAILDLQNDGWPDIFVTHLVGEGNGLFVNRDGYFSDTTRAKGPGAPSFPFTGFGVGFADFDHDGHLDLYVANGRIKYGDRQFDPKDPYAEPDTLLRGMGNGEFEEAGPTGGVVQLLAATGRGAALGDLDNDGDIDLVVVNRDGPLHLLKNIAPKQGRWIMFRVRHKNGTDAINATIRVEAEGRTFTRQVLPNQGYCSSNDPRVHFGLGTAPRVEHVVVRWPSGGEEAFGPLETGRLYELWEGGKVEALPHPR